MFCHLPDSERRVTSVFQGLSLSRSRGREGEDPRNEVADIALRAIYGQCRVKFDQKQFLVRQY